MVRGMLSKPSQERAMGADSGDADAHAAIETPRDTDSLEGDLTHDGPFFSLTLHWA